MVLTLHDYKAESDLFYGCRGLYFEKQTNKSLNMPRAQLCLQSCLLPPRAKCCDRCRSSCALALCCTVLVCGTEIKL